ncbi:MAG TPA: nitronate monooxygenase [Burkholderiales bacterium]|nr:nitronate monooxygenase [Burkholderiales bacterium]
MKTNRIAELLSIRYPIFQAPMGRTAPPRLAAAVTNAGGLGMLGTSWDAPRVMREKIRATQALTHGPFAVNLAMPWDQHERLDIALEEGVKAVSLFWGDPSPYLRKAKDAGAVVIHTVATPEEARRAVDLGADLIVAQGVESGGHVWSTVSTMVLVPLVCDAIPGVPVIAAGGMADIRGVRAALALGAKGVWLGTRFLATVESGAHDDYKQRLLAARSTDTIYTTLFDQGWPDAPHRALRNSTVEMWEKAGCPSTGRRPREGELVGAFPNGDPIRRYAVPAPMQGATGEIESFALYAGQSVGLIRDLPPVAAVMVELAPAFV